MIFQFSLEVESRVEICECDIAEFEKAELLARGQTYNPNEPIRLVKFDAPKAIKVNITAMFLERKKIENADGFAICPQKLVIFVAK